MNITEKQIKLLEIFLKSVANKRRVKILLLIYKNENNNVGEISKKLQVNYQTTAAHIQRLEKTGLIVKKYKGLEVRHLVTGRGLKFIEFFKNILSN